MKDRVSSYDYDFAMSIRTPVTSMVRIEPGTGLSFQSLLTTRASFVHKNSMDEIPSLTFADLMAFKGPQAL